ncbi:flagellar hook-basal body complex protein [Clostridium sp. D53t1_180928_C8]|uniref:flagellar hook-basal body complex protein n=1 Tax=Clostridium sp. D53t1_180928_C8 TaxID=2787101 RepID=UPI0018A9011C|nr:flagellar hook-basal body complex protein [Clostridium sp. D53t1_180928_C8]
MLRGMYSSVSAMINLQSSQNVITNNIANLNTTGYKSETLVSKTFDDVLISNNDKYVNGKGTKQELGVLNPGVKIDEVGTNYNQGTLVETDNETDFALNGKGFFTVRDTKGMRYYTRDGVFNVNSEGYLVNSLGYEVLNSNNQSIYVGNSKILMDSNNNIILDSGVTHKFNIVGFDDYSILNKIGRNLYTGENARVSNNYEVRNKHKESSNVDIIDVTSALMSNLRAFEANQKVVQVMDSTLSKIATEIGTVR